MMGRIPPLWKLDDMLSVESPDPGGWLHQRVVDPAGRLKLFINFLSLDSTDKYNVENIYPIRMRITYSFNYPLARV